MIRAHRVGVVAERLGVSVRTVRRLIDRGTVAAWRLPSGHWRVAADDLAALLANRNGYGATPTHASVSPANDREPGKG